MSRLNHSFLSTIMTKSSKFFVFVIYLVLILGASYVFYESYTQYSELNSEKYELKRDKKTIVEDLELRKSEKITLMISAVVVLLFSLFLLSRRKYLFKYIALENQNLKRLLEDIERYPDTDKIAQFKTMLKNRNTAEIYELMSEIIEELQENQKLADEANKTKSLFLANMSHEIRTPLNGIIGFTKFLNSTELNDEQHEFVDIIRKSSEDLLGIVNDILDISKIENGQVELEEVYFNPMEEFENVIESYAANASKKDIDFSLWIDPSFAAMLVRSDPGKIKQVLINLISNAVKFTNKKGTIDVIIEHQSTQDEQLDIKFTVKDDGIGISKEQEEKVFEAFTQADSTTSRKYGGTGLGLTISAKLVHALGGALKVESAEGEGSSFYFTLRVPMKKIERLSKTKAMKMAIYAPSEVQEKDSHHYLESYLLSFKKFSTMRFNSFEECIHAPSSSFDALYVHYDTINKEELEKIVAHHGAHANIVLVTKLNKRHLVKEISAKFASILYEPITFSKVEKTFDNLLKENAKKESGKKIFSDIYALVIEDNPINQKMIQHTLKSIGITSDCANNGQEGLEMYMKNHEAYDVVFMDIQMPVMNGVDATKAILAYNQANDLEHTPIIAVTANALKGDKERFLAEGMDAYVSKPINLEKFIEVLKIFFKEDEDSQSLPRVSTTDILLYKETPMEAKIISAILNKLDYSVDVVDNLEELKKVMDVNSYKCILLDRVHNEIEHSNLSQQIKAKEIPSLLFVDGKSVIAPTDKENFTFISDKVADYQSLKNKVDQMIGLAKVS